MTDQELVQALHDLGLSTEEHRTLLLLPLVQVAWADNQVQDRERQAILAVAKEMELSPDAQGVLQGWLTNDPGVQVAQRGQDVLRELARRQDVSLASMDRLVAQAEQVARAAGGMLGMFTIDRRERDVLRDIEGNLSGSAIDFTAGGWDDVLELA